MKYGIGLGQAFRTLSIIRFPGKDAKTPSSSLYYYPIVGVAIGVLGLIIPYLLRRYLKTCDNYLSSLLCGGIYTVFLAILTRGFHLDGLGDTADGFGGAWDKERILSIMSDSRTGSFGVTAISLVLILKTLSYGILLNRQNYLIMIYVIAVSRSMVVFLCSFGTYAKEYGLSYELVSNAGIRHTAVSMVMVGAFSLLLLKKGCNYGQICVSFCASLVAMTVLYAISYKKIRGITGDVLGACAELTEVVSALVAALI